MADPVRWVLLVVAVAWAYAAAVYWLVFGRGPFQVVYQPVIGALIRWAGMEATTIGARCYLGRRDAVLSATGERHERYHYERQWRVYPLTFLPRYMYQLVRYGYDRCPMENEARAAAGEPVR